MKLSIAISSALVASAAMPLYAQNSEQDPEAIADAARAKLIASLDAAYESNLQSKSDTSRWFVAKGVVADRQTGEVSIEAWSTGIVPGSVCEFFLITLNSGHDYESVFQTAAFAGDIAKAVEFLGVPKGKAVNQRELHLWPKGESITASVSVDGGEGRPLTDFVFDRQTNAPKPWRNFLYIGGYELDDGSNAADSLGPGSILSDYNEPITIFDIPSMAFQSDVYESNVVSTNAPSEAFLPAVITLKPENRQGLSERRVAEDELFFDGETGLFKFPEAGSTPVPSQDFFARLKSRIDEEKRDVYLSVSWSDNTSFSDLFGLANMLAAVDKDETGVRIDAPPESFVYYRALLPLSEWRDRSKRYSQPCELRLSKGDDGVISATLVVITEEWEGESITAKLAVEEIPGVTPESLPALLAAKAPPRPPVLLVFVPGNATWADFKPFFNAARPTHPQVQLFVD